MSERASVGTAPENEIYIARGSAEFRKAAFSMVAAGFSTFALMNCVQPLMPIFSQDLGVSAPQASLSLSLNIAALAVTMPIASSLSEAIGRKNVMTTSLVISALLMIASAFSASWNHFLVYRALQGVAFSGLPAVAMAYMGEEVDPRQRGYAIGLYVSGAAFGGMAGRVISGLLADSGGWRLSIAAIGILGLLTAAFFSWMLPASRHFRKQPIHPRAMLASYAAHAKNPMQRALYLLGFLFMGSLVATYNYLGYRLIAPPFSLSHTLIGLLFTIYLVGIASSTYAGRLADSFGRPVILIASIVTALAGLLVMSIDQVAAVIAGLMIFTGGFFAAHSVASGWVGANATSSKAQASSLYLFFYYSGGALFGWAGGLFWEVLQWEGVTLMVGTILTIALLTAIYLRRCAIAKAGVVWTRDG